MLLRVLQTSLYIKEALKHYLQQQMRMNQTHIFPSQKLPLEFKGGQCLQISNVHILHKGTRKRLQTF